MGYLYRFTLTYLETETFVEAKSYCSHFLADGS